MSGAPRRIGVVSDTHGTLSDEASAALAGVDAIVHAGDVGEGYVLDELRAIAPLTVVRGNCDRSGDAVRLPDVRNEVVAGVRVYVTHRRADLPRPIPAGVRLVVTGHSHAYRFEEQDGVAHLNPGSASVNRGFGCSVAIVTVGDDDTLLAERVSIP